MDFKDQVCEAMDALAAVKRVYHQGQSDYETVSAAAVRVLQLRQTIEKAKMGKVKTRINAVSIASLIR
jgi:DNA-directed RNA polymerase subunit K/omega